MKAANGRTKYGRPSQRNCGNNHSNKIRDNANPAAKAHTKTNRFVKTNRRLAAAVNVPCELIECQFYPLLMKKRTQFNNRCLFVCQTKKGDDFSPPFSFMKLNCRFFDYAGFGDGFSTCPVSSTSSASLPGHGVPNRGRRK